MPTVLAFHTVKTQTKSSSAGGFMIEAFCFVISLLPEVGAYVIPARVMWRCKFLYLPPIVVVVVVVLLLIYHRLHIISYIYIAFFCVFEVEPKHFMLAQQSFVRLLLASDAGFKRF